eukprot:COSAG01_NODE_5475_length_4236_cov_1111.481267_6_plen_70_part_00
MGVCTKAFEKVVPFSMSNLLSFGIGLGPGTYGILWAWPSSAPSVTSLCECECIQSSNRKVGRAWLTGRR